MDIKKVYFYSKVFIFNKNTFQIYNSLLKNQFLSTDELTFLNWNKRKLIVSHAYNKTLFYKKKYDKVGFHPNDLLQPDDYDKIPILTKGEIQDNFNEICVQDVPNKYLWRSVTGGSTGKPLEVYHDLRFPNYLLGWRMLKWWGLSPIEKQAIIYRISSNIKNNSWIGKLREWPMKTIYLDASNMTLTTMDCFATELKKLKPSILMGYVGAVEHFANYILTTGDKLPGLKLVWVTSAPVSATQRTIFKQVFEVPVLDQYGCCEVYWLAAQCPYSYGLHFFYDTRHIEFLDNDLKRVTIGNYGQIALTDLENYAFPLIRYLNGDVGRWLSNSCSCGCNLPIIDSIKGRITDIITLPNGDSIAGEYLTTIFDQYPNAVKQFQIIQHSDLTITLKIVKNANYINHSLEIEKVLRNLTNIVKKQVKINLLEVNTIKHDRGKIKFVLREKE